MPSDQPELPVFDAHRASLRDAFVERLLREAPLDVLDVGAGDGSLVASLALQGIEARGVEANEARVRAAREAGLSVRTGSADDLGEADGSVGWVTVRHVLHHLPDPRAAVREALRVAKVGVMIAEPFAASGLPAHGATERLERFLRRLDRARGAHHDDNIPPGDLAGWLPGEWRQEFSVLAPMTRLPSEEVERMVARSAAGVALDPRDRALADGFVQAARRGEVAASGSAVLLAWRPD